MDFRGIVEKAQKNINEFLEKKTKLQKLIVILGPTASGKTGLSIELAKNYNAEIVSADSRQIYKYMDIGTAKITKKEMAGVPHHMVDRVDPDNIFTVSDYYNEVMEVISDINKRGKIPFLVGGTGLYISAITENYNFSSKHQPDQNHRLELEEYLKKNGAIALHKKLEEKDIEIANNVHPNNTRYIIRALEKLKQAKDESLDKKGDKKFDILYLGIKMNREDLYQKINLRVNHQIEIGWLKEVKFLLDQGYSQDLPSMSSIGYKELIRHINNELSITDAVIAIQTATRNYAKRQLTWFRRNKEIIWL